MNSNSIYRNFLILRPILKEMYTDKNNMPLISFNNSEALTNKNIKLRNFRNYKNIKNKNITILIMFSYDEVIENIWKNPLKYVNKFNKFLAIATPDFRVYPNMSKIEIEHNVFKSRWVGSLWKTYKLNVIPTVSWCYEDTYDICFSGIEYGSVVIISTLGISKNKDIFLKGFNELKRRINPKLIIVVGNLVKGMEGNFLIFSYKETLNIKNNYEQLSLCSLNNNIQIDGGRNL